MTRRIGRPRWIDQLPAGLRDRVNAAVDCRDASVPEIHARLRLGAYCSLRGLYHYAAGRRARIEQYEAQQGRRLSRAARATVKADLSTVQPKPRWWQETPAFRRAFERALPELDFGVEPAAAIYRRWNVVRFCGPRAFRAFVRRRRAAGGKNGLRHRDDR